MGGLAIWYPLDFWVVVRTQSDPLKLALALRRTVWEVDKDQPIDKVVTLEQWVREYSAGRRFYLWILRIFVGLASALATIGIYGVVARSVAQRTHELGVRSALGASRKDILLHVICQGLRFSLIGTTIGIVCALGFTLLLAHMLFEVKPADPMALVVVSIFLLLTGLLACSVPALRATKIEPMAALRDE
jgi:putative ABC transport system permease protein